MINQFTHQPGRGGANTNTSPSTDGGSTRQPSGFFDLQAHEQLPEPAPQPTPAPLDHTPAHSFSNALPTALPTDEVPELPALTLRTSAQAVAAWLQQDGQEGAEEGAIGMDEECGGRPEDVVAVSVSAMATSTPPTSPPRQQQDISPQGTLRSSRSSSSDLWAAFSAAGSPGGSARRLKLESFDKVLGRQAIVSQRTGVFEAQAPHKVVAALV